MKRGKVLFFKFTLGYGFITDSETKEEIFVNKKSLIDRQLDPDDEVEYDIKQDKAGKIAFNVKKISKEESDTI